MEIRRAVPVGALVIVALLGGLFIQRRAVIAAAASPGQPQEKQAGPAAPAMPKPGPEMERLKFLLGTWEFKSEYQKTPMLPQGAKETGWYKAQMGPGGFSVIADFDADGPMGKEIGHQLLVWDPKEKTYKLFTLGNSFPGVIAATARWEGGELVTSAEFSEGGMKMSLRSVYKDIQEKSVTIEEWLKAGDAPYQLFLKTIATKK